MSKGVGDRGVTLVCTVGLALDKPDAEEDAFRGWFVTVKTKLPTKTKFSKTENFNVVLTEKEPTY